MADEIEIHRNEVRLRGSTWARVESGWDLIIEGYAWHGASPVEAELLDALVEVRAKNESLRLENERLRAERDEWRRTATAGWGTAWGTS